MSAAQDIADFFGIVTTAAGVAPGVLEIASLAVESSTLAILTFLVLHAMEQGANIFAVVAVWTTLGLAGLLAPAFWQPLLVSQEVPPIGRAVPPHSGWPY